MTPTLKNFGADAALCGGSRRLSSAPPLMLRRAFFTVPKRSFPCQQRDHGSSDYLWKLTRVRTDNLIKDRCSTELVAIKIKLPGVVRPASLAVRSSECGSQSPVRLATFRKGGPQRFKPQNRNPQSRQPTALPPLKEMILTFQRARKVEPLRRKAVALSD